MSRRQQLITAVTTACLCLLATASPQSEDKWSRQLEATGPGQADSFDWVPLAQPVDGSDTKDRSANGRVLTYSQAFPPDGRFGNIQKAHNAQLPQQQPFDFPYQFQRFSNGPQQQTLRQQQPLKSSALQPQEPTSQSFFKFEMPFHSDGHRPASAPSSLQTGYQIQHTFGGGAQATLFNSPLYNQNPIFPPEFHPVPPKPQQQPLQQQKPLHQQNFIEDTYPLKNSFRESSKPVQHALESLQAVAPQVFPSDAQPETLFEQRKPSSFQSNSPFLRTAPSAAPAPPLSSLPSSQSNPSEQQQDVQLLYVPYDTLYNQQQRPTGPPSGQSNAFEVNKFNVNPGLPSVNPYQINQFYTQDPFSPEEHNFYTTSTTHRPYTTTTTTTTNKPVFQSFNNQQYTTQKPKPKAHQPPLAMFLLRNSARPTQGDVVSILRNANTIAVLDAPTKHTPDIFVGPSGMPIPNGYVKFDLPYLSQLSQPRDLRGVSFFVAPLSYRTPNGFNKILLPEPHVGSIVINRSKDNYNDSQQQPQQPQQSSQPHQNAVYITPNQNDYVQNSYQSSTPRTRPSTHRPRPQQASSPKDYYPDVLREPSQYQKNRNPFETTTQRGGALQPSRGNKFNYFYDQEAIQEVTSPKITKHDRPKKKRPQVVQVEQPVYPQKINNPYAQFQPMPNQIVTDDYYKIETTRPTSTSTSTSTSTTTTTTSTTPAPTFYQFTTNPQIEYQSANGQLYHDFTTAPREPEEYMPPYTTRPPTATTAEEEYRMKQYFRQQNAFRNRPQVVSSTNSPFEYVNYTPAAPEYETPAPTQRPTTYKQRVTYYSPTALPTTPIENEPLQTIPPRTEYSYEETQTEFPKDNNLPNNHRPLYNQNEILDGTVEYEPNPYQLPSELPPLTANLPGLVNGLQDKDKQANEEGSTATPTYTQEPSTSSTRRPNRTRKPVIAKVSSSVSYSESESPIKRPSHRIRRPYGSRATATPSSATVSYEDDGHSTTTTRRPHSSRTDIIRNPNRVRYQPTPEERQTLRIKPRKKYTGSNKVKETEDLDYQRDVLKQNYPVFRPAGTVRRPTSPTADPMDPNVETTTDRYTSESQQIYTVTPSNNNVDNNEQVFPAGLLEPMQIAQQYNHYSKNNYGPGYFPNQEDLIPTEPIGRNEIHPVYTTTPSTTTTTVTTTTTEEPLSVVTGTTRRSPFIRRNYPRLRPTTTEAPTTTTASPDERQSTRARLPPRKVIKVRARTRRPAYQASTTSAPDEYVEQQEDVEPKNNYRKLNRFNQDLYENDTPTRRYKQKFHLDGQESQWSPSVKATNKNAFKPVALEEEPKENTHNFENEPEIVTADSEHDQANEKPADTFELKVSANLNSPNADNKTDINEPNMKPEKSFAELLEEVMGRAPEESTTESELTLRTTESTFFESQKTAISNRINRRGKWKKVRTSPTRPNNGESFETAESQNLGAQLLNSLYTDEQKETKPVDQQQPKTSTPTTPTTTTAVPELTTMPAITMTTTPTPQTTMDDYDMTTARIIEYTTMPTTLPMNAMDDAKQTTTTMPDTTQETTTHRPDEYDPANEDDLETQPSLFSEVKRQLHELFSIEESEDQALDGALVAVGRRRQEYTNIQRPKPESTTDTPQTTEATKTESVSETSAKDPFHKNLMEHVVYATATSTKVSSETEICYRGRCIRSEDLPPNHKLN